MTFDATGESGYGGVGEDGGGAMVGIGAGLEGGVGSGVGMLPLGRGKDTVQPTARILARVVMIIIRPTIGDTLSIISLEDGRWCTFRLIISLSAQGPEDQTH